MIGYSPLLCLDFYKTAHAEQYPQTLTRMVSYYTPRMTRLDDTKKVTLAFRRSSKSILSALLTSGFSGCRGKRCFPLTSGFSITRFTPTALGNSV